MTVTDAPAPKFAVGNRVVAKRERRLVMDITDVDARLIATRRPMYRCVPAEEHSAAHGRGRSPRWFREDDIETAS